MVQKGDRAFFSRELFFEIPVVVFTYLIGTGICAAMGWQGAIYGAVTAAIAYLGPGGVQTFAQWYVKMYPPPGNK